MRYEATATLTLKVRRTFSRTGSYREADTLEEQAMDAIEAERGRIEAQLAEGLEVEIDETSLRVERGEIEGAA